MARARRPSRWTLRLLLTLVMPLGASALSAQQSETAGLMLRVRDRETGHAVVNARVSVVAGPVAGFTDDSGRVALAVAGGRQELEIAALGYVPKRISLKVPGGGSAEVDVRLEISAIPLRGVDVPVQRRDAYLEREGFYQRQRFSAGSFFWGDQLAARVHRASFLADLFQGMRGFAVRPGSTGTTHVLISTRGVNSLSQGCYPKIYVDGVDSGWERRGVDSYGGAGQNAPGAGSSRPIPNVGSSKGPSSAGGRDVDQIVPPAIIAGIEAYASAADAPEEYGKHPCGIVLIWTRHGP